MNFGMAIDLQIMEDSAWGTIVRHPETKVRILIMKKLKSEMAAMLSSLIQLKADFGNKNACAPKGQPDNPCQDVDEGWTNHVRAGVVLAFKPFGSDGSDLPDPKPDSSFATGKRGEIVEITNEGLACQERVSARGGRIPIGAALLALIGLLILNPSTLHAQIDPNDKLTTADSLAAPSLRVPTIMDWGKLTPASDVDLFKITVAAGSILGFDVDNRNGSVLDSYLRIFDSLGNELWHNDDAAGPGEANSGESFLQVTFPSGGVYYLGVSGYPNRTYNATTGTGDVASYTTGDYSLTVEDLRPSLQIAGIVTDTVTGLGISGAAVSFGTFSEITDSSGVYFLDKMLCGSGIMTVTRLGYESYTSIYSPICQACSTKNIALTPSDPNDQISEAEFLGSTSFTAPTIVMDWGKISDLDVDMFAVDLQAGQRVGVDLDCRNNSGLDSYLRIFDSTGKELGANDDGSAPGESGSTESYLEFTAQSSGRFYIGISGWGNSSYSAITGSGDLVGDTGDYSLTISDITLPIIASISPDPGIGANSLSRFLATGSHFAPDAVVTVSSGGIDFVISQSHTTVLNNQQIEFYGVFGTDPASWSATVGNFANSVKSAPLHFSIVAPRPNIGAISPANCPAGGPSVTLRIDGETFQSRSVIRWNGIDKVTTPILSSGGALVVGLTAIIPALDLRSPGSASIAVWNPGPGGGLSLPVSFNLVSVAPEITSITTIPVIGANSPISIIFRGIGFTSGDQLTLRNAGRDYLISQAHTIVRSATEIEIQAVIGTQPSSWAASVLDPTSGLRSSPYEFEVQAPLPQIDSFSPSTATAGDATITLNIVSGTCQPTSYVCWNGAARPTSPILSAVGFVTGLQASISATDLLTPGNAVITVVSPGPGGGVSAPVSFAITPPVDIASITVRGNVLDAKTHQPISGVEVSVDGLGTSTIDGAFEIRNFPSNGALLTFSGGSYIPTSRPVVPTAGSRLITLGPVFLVTQTVANVNRPVITGQSLEHNGIYISGVPMPNRLSACVRWPQPSTGEVKVYLNDSLIHTLSGRGPNYTCDVDMGAFPPAFGHNQNRIKIVATAGNTTCEAEIPVSIIPAPGILRLANASLAPFTMLPGNDPQLSFALRFPDEKIPSSALKEIPFLGKIGLDLAVGAGFEYAPVSGEWQFHAGLEPKGRFAGRDGSRLHSTPSKPKAYLGNREFEFAVEAFAKGVVTPTGGTFADVIGMKISIDLERDILTLYLKEIVPALQWTTAFDVLRTVGIDINSVQKVTVFGKVAAELALSYNSFSPLDFKETTLAIAPGVRLAYEPDLKFAKAKIYAGGNFGGTFQLSPGIEFQKVTGSMFGGMSFTTLGYVLFHGEYVFLNYEYPKPSVARAHSDLADNWVFLPVRSDGLRPMSREHLLAGPEGFVAGEGDAQLDGFGMMSASPPMGSISNPTANKARASSSPKDGDIHKTELQSASVTVCTNIFPGSSPALATMSNRLMLLSVRDNGSTNPISFTDIEFTLFDGTNWSSPAVIEENDRWEGNPKVVFDGNGDAVAIWERVSKPHFDQVDISAMAQQLEIVYSRFDSKTRLWQSPEALTTNTVLDHAPLLCGPMGGDGSLIALWTRNDQNLLTGTNDGGASLILSREWSPSTKTWGPERVVATNVVFRLSQSLASNRDKAVYVLTQDLSGSLTNRSAQQLFNITWTNGGWGPLVQVTTDTEGNSNARVAIDRDTGDVWETWFRGSNLVVSCNFTNPTLVRSDAGIADYETIAGARNLVMIWQSMNDAGSDLTFSVLDRLSGEWSLDGLLTCDPPLETSFAPVFDDLGNLTVAFNRVQTVYQDKIVVLPNGSSLSITNVPTPGRVDLAVSKRALVRDLELRSGEFRAIGESFLPGDEVSFVARPHNTGNVAEQNVVVSFWDGPPNIGGVLISNAILPGWLAAGATNEITVTWKVPSPATNHHIYAVVNPSSLLGEFDPANNTQRIAVGGSDLCVDLVNSYAETNGALRVIARVTNPGSPTRSRPIVAIRRATLPGIVSTNEPLSSAEVPLLEPGQKAEIELVLGPGTQIEAQALYQLDVFEPLVTDIVPGNNNTTFSINLWIDIDDDGIPDQWMVENFGHPSAQSFDQSRPHDDPDGDGVNNYGEYISGTDPHNPGSSLRIETLAFDLLTRRIDVTFPSVANRTYDLLGASALDGAFRTVVSNVLANPPENHITLTNQSGAGFYRLRTQ